MGFPKDVSASLIDGCHEYPETVRPETVQIFGQKHFSLALSRPFLCEMKSGLDL